MTLRQQSRTYTSRPCRRRYSSFESSRPLLLDIFSTVLLQQQHASLRVAVDKGFAFCVFTHARGTACCLCACEIVSGVKSNTSRNLPPSKKRQRNTVKLTANETQHNEKPHLSLSVSLSRCPLSVLWTLPVCTGALLVCVGVGMVGGAVRRCRGYQYGSSACTTAPISLYKRYISL